ncbi:MAG: hypothetical protein AMXMBFR66_08960 [Pseudomonadota bacterium]|nr:hypothetical protein [Rubrivivax sp.]NLZ40994.1 hypothetical protein [Comamonadaceae bacterium]
MKTLVLLTSRGGGHCMHIAEEIERGTLPGLRLAAVVTDNPDAEVLGKCRRRGLRCDVLPWPGRERAGEHDERLARHLQALAPDLVGLVGYLRIVRQATLSRWGEHLFNLHPSLLPAYPGLDAIARAWHAGEARLGATLHRVDAGVDTGAALARIAVRAGAVGSLEAATAAVHRAEALLLGRALRAWLDGGGWPAAPLEWSEPEDRP